MIRVAATHLFKLASCGLFFSTLSQFAIGQSELPKDTVDKATVSRQAFELLRTRCYQCHGEQSQYENLDVLDRESLVAQEKFLVPGDPEKSTLWQAIHDNRMPKGASSDPESRSRPLTLEEKKVLFDWIKQGAEFPSRTRFGKLKFVTRGMVLQGISEFLRKKRDDQRHFYKFFSLASVYNNPANSDDDVAMRRAALSKILNCISRSSRIVIPEAIPGTENTVYAVHWTEDLQLELAHWRAVLQQYPFGLKLTSGANDEISQLYKNLEELIRPETERDGIYVIRADWFVATASRPPLYHTLAGIPQEFSGIETELGINTAENFNNGRARRIAIQRSGVSKQNRVLEWHDARSRKGTLWLSYDFGRNVGKATIEIRPLGPKKIVTTEALKGFAFEHDGGELIYPRPNGLHGYMLTTADGKRIDAGPIDIVSDPSEAAGTPQIVNGISCMHCHRHGILSKYDAPPDTAVIGNILAKEKVQQVYVSEKVAMARFQDDRRDFLDALSQAIGPFLLSNYEDLNREERIKAVERFDDPVSIVARQYRTDLGIRQVTMELDWEEGAEQLAFKLDDSGLKKFGVGPLVKRGAGNKFRSGVIKRDLWDDRDVDGESLFQTVARKLEIGTPINHAKSTP